MNALRANGYIGYLDGSIPPPVSTILDSENTRITNPEFTLWTLIDNQLLSCLTASLSPATLPHVLGLEHVTQVWHTLEHRFNSISKSHIHELRSRLYSVTKTGTMDSYIDEIRNCVQRLEAVGYHVEGSDMVFCAIKGLPPAFKGIRSALNTIRGDILFDELATILRNEEAQIHKDEGEIGTSTSKVLLTTQKTSPLVPSSQSHDHEASGSGSQLLQAALPSPLGFSMYQTPNTAGPYYPQQNFQQFNRGLSFNGGFNRGRGGRGSGFGVNTRTECQICGKNKPYSFLLSSQAKFAISAFSIYCFFWP